MSLGAKFHRLKPRKKAHLINISFSSLNLIFGLRKVKLMYFFLQPLLPSGRVYLREKIPGAILTNQVLDCDLDIITVKGKLPWAFLGPKNPMGSLEEVQGLGPLLVKFRVKKLGSFRLN